MQKAYKLFIPCQNKGAYSLRVCACNFLNFPSFSGSWVKLDGSCRNGNGVQHSPVISEDGGMEDLLLEAVEEHKNGFR